MSRMMILPSTRPDGIRLVRVPADFEDHEAFRRATGLIAQVEEKNPQAEWAEIAEVLEDNGFQPLDFILGPEI